MCSLSQNGFGPYMPNLRVVPYNDVNALKVRLSCFFQVHTHANIILR